LPQSSTPYPPIDRVDALRRSEERFRPLVHATSQIVWTADPDGIVTEDSPSWRAFTGQTYEQYRARGWVDAVHPDDRATADSEWKASVIRRGLYEVEYRLRRFDGEYRWTQARGVPILAENGTIREWVGVNIDITSRRRAEAQLREQRVRERAYLEQLPVGVWFLDAAGTITYGNPAAQQVWQGARFVGPDKYHEYKGYDPETGALIPPNQWAGARAILRGETVLDQIAEIVCFDGSRKTIRNSAVPTRDASGRVTGAIVFNQDITKERYDEEKLRESEHRFREVLDTQTEPLCRFRTDGTILFVNFAYARARNLAPEQLEGRSFFDFIPPAKHAFIRQQLETITRDNPVVKIENEFHTQNGTRWFLWHNRAIAFDDQGQMTEAQATGFDITDLKLAEQARLQSDARLREARERLDAALAASCIGTFRWNMVTNELSWDKNLDRLFGLPPGESARSLPMFLALVHDEDRQAVVNACNECRQGADFSMEFRVVWPDGSVRWLHDKGRTFFDDQGAPSYMTGACVDITDRKIAPRSRD
jgi:PAS domain S-box-containing protein